MNFIQRSENNRTYAYWLKLMFNSLFCGLDCFLCSSRGKVFCKTHSQVAKHWLLDRVRSGVA